MDDDEIVTQGVPAFNDPGRAEVDQLKSRIAASLRGPLDLTTLLERELPPLDFTLGPLGLLRHVCGVLSAEGGAGKGYCLLGLAVSVACEDADIPFFGIERFPAPPKRGPVVLLLAEDTEAVLNSRLQALLRGVERRYGGKAVRSIMSNLDVESLHDQAPCLVDKGGDIDAPRCRAWQEIIAERVRAARLFALDTVSCYHRANENDNGEMTVLVQVCNWIASHSDGSALLLHHAPKGSPEQSRGASALTNSARWACSLVRDKQHNEKVEVRQWKENYMALVDAFTLTRSEGGILTGVTADANKKAGNGHKFRVAK